MRMSHLHIYGLTLEQRLSVQKKIEKILKQEFPNGKLEIKNNLIIVNQEEMQNDSSTK